MGLLDNFEFIDDAAEKVDKLVEQAERTKGKIEKRKLLTEAQNLADAYQKHCETGGNTVKQFKPLL